MANKLFVGGLSYDTTQDELTKLFASCGTVADVKLIMDRETGRSKGFAFIEMGSDAEAKAAILKLNGTTVGQRSIFINEARPKEERLEGPAPRTVGPGSPGFVERRSGVKDRRRQPGAPGGEKKWGAEAAPRRESFGEKKWGDKPAFGGEKKWSKPGGFGPKKWGDKPGGDRKPGGFGPKKWGDKPGGDRKPGGFGPKKWGDKPGGDKKPGGFGPKKWGKPGGKPGFGGKPGGFGKSGGFGKRGGRRD
jgi:hypothetical protein